MNNLAVRKALLIKESELLRAGLVYDACQLKRTAGVLAGDYAVKALKVGSVAGAATALIAGISALRHKPRSSLLGKLFSGARLATSIWLAMRPSQR